MACFRGNSEEFYGEVLLLDDTKLTLTAADGLKKSSKAAAVLHQVFSHLNVVEVEFFGLRFCDDKQQTFWLDPLKSLSQHRDLCGPPYIFYFGVRFYVENPSKLQQETTRYQFYLQLRQDIRRGRLLSPAHLRPRLGALALQAERGDYDEAEWAESEDDQEVQHIYKSLSGVSRPQAQILFMSLCCSLEMYGVCLFTAYGENHTEYFLGPTPVGVVIYKNKVLVGKYFWQRITKLHFRDDMFELRVVGKNGLETSFFFQTLCRSDCKRMWRCCVEHHAFFRMSDSNPLTRKLKYNSSVLRLNISLRKNKSINKTTMRPTPAEAPRPTPAEAPRPTPAEAPRPTPAEAPRPTHCTNQTADVSSEPMFVQTAPSALHRSEGRVSQRKGSAPWESHGASSGMFNPNFPPNTRRAEECGGRPQRRSRSLDGDRPIRQQKRRSRSHDNTSSESEKTARNSEHRRRRTKNRGCHGDQTPESTCNRRHRSRSPDAVVWKHIQKQLVEPDGLIDRQTEEIPYKEVRVKGQPIRPRRSPTGRRHRQWASATDLHSKTELVPPLPVTTAAGTSCGLPTSP